MNIHEFYEADERRRESEEVQFGDGWTDDADAHATYRAKWVVETGELYTVREPHPGGILARYLDQLGIDQAKVGDLLVDVLAVSDDLPAVEAALDGWESAMDAENSLRWLRARAAAVAPMPAAAPSPATATSPATAPRPFA